MTVTAFDTDILTLIVRGNPAIVARAATIPRHEQVVPVIVLEECFRGWLAAVRKADTTKNAAGLVQAYSEFARSVALVGRLTSLPYTTTADDLFNQWRAAKIRIGTQDLRIAAICVAHGATLVTRNARDYSQVPGLNLEVWQ